MLIQECSQTEGNQLDAPFGKHNRLGGQVFGAGRWLIPNSLIRIGNRPVTRFPYPTAPNPSLLRSQSGRFGIAVDLSAPGPVCENFGPQDSAISLARHLTQVFLQVGSEPAHGRSDRPMPRPETRRHVEGEVRNKTKETLAGNYSRASALRAHVTAYWYSSGDCSH